MKIKAFLVAFALLGASAAQASTIEQIAASTYKLYEDNRPICTAVAISPTQLATANHCVDGENLNVRVEKLDAEFKILSSDVRYVKTVRTSKEHDQAMLELKDPDLKFETFVDIAKPEEVKLSLGTPIITVGYPKVMEITLTHGEFSSLASLTDMDPDMKKPFYKSTIPVTGGNSGGGLYSEIGPLVGDNLEKNYKLIGLTTGGFRDVSFMNYFSTVDGLKSLTASLIKLDILDTIKPNPDIKLDEGVRDGLINPEDLR